MHWWNYILYYYGRAAELATDINATQRGKNNKSEYGKCVNTRDLWIYECVMFGVHVCMCVCICVRTYVCIYAYYMHVFIYLCTYVRKLCRFLQESICHWIREVDDYKVHLARHTSRLYPDCEVMFEKSYHAKSM